MKANEIRVGNLFNGIKIESITPTGVNFYTGYEGYNETPFEKLKPIPLAPEILEKAGFEFVNGKWVCNEIDITSWYTFKFSEHPLKVQEIDYLHQLQNLYFALTGEELEINM